MSQTESKKAVVRAYVAALNAGNWGRLREIFAPGATRGVTGSAPIEQALARVSLASVA